MPSDIDAELRQKIAQLAEYRRRIAQLASGEGLLLPPEVVGLLERMRALGISERRVRLERDSWILLRALDPRSIPRRVREKHADLDDPGTRRLYLACDQSVDWDPDDPRVDRLIDDLDAWETARRRDGDRAEFLELVSARISETSPAWQRVIEALAHRAERRRAAGREG
ncbi:hypothetical protein [Streptomyces orinoci]|uniref:Uncharacterized protein n=1 Tax=Streptomyces orinoci TaxID=67339 RepID=A0ABV3JU62_STRON|nr:hypothetical protein [Streptomyces orinoci]